MRRLIVVTTLLAAVVPAAAAQQPPPRERERERAFVFSFGPEDFRFDLRRGRLGILVDLTADAARDSVGARVAGVTPGGPADRAGVRVDDLVVRFNGTRLAAAAGREEEADADQSRPGLRLIRLASRLDPGDTVRLELRRDGRAQTVSLVAQETDMDRIVKRMRIPGPGGDLLRGLPFGVGQGRVRTFEFGSSLSDLELVRVNPGLAEYFGTSEGLLVVDVGADTALGLRAGDVILSIGGRRPTSPSHAMRILSTYESRETVAFEVMRQKRRQTVSGRMPESRGRWRVEPNSFDLHRLRLPDLHLRGPEIRWHVEPPHIRIEGMRRIGIGHET
jgi:hypothetical protein